MEINYFKSKKLDLGKLEKQFEKEKVGEKEKTGEKEKGETKKQIKYNPFEITDLQNYNPIYSLFFEINETTYNHISLNHPKHFLDLNTIFDETQQKKKTNIPIYIKYAPLLDPIHYLIGKYEKERTRLRNLPKFNIDTNAIPKITSVYNTAYTDCFFSYLSSQLLNHYELKNGIDFYGSFLGIQKKFKMDITDDYEYLLESDFFHSQQHKLYEIDIEQNVPNLSNDESNNYKPRLIFGEDITFEIETDIFTHEEIEIEEKTEEKAEDSLELIYEKNKGEDGEDDDDEECSLVSLSEEEEEEVEEEDEDDEEEEWSDIDDDNTSEELQVCIYIHDFPVQMICLEKCEGTFDDLLENGILNDDQIISAVFQVIMTLIAYQKAYYFTHNDLHTNNIVYITTKKEWIEYEFAGQKYKVPTYGRIFKIIDFGRSIYRYQDKLFCSDSFAPGGDAHYQYNTEPFITTNKPRLETNFSFDLSRLGCSLYDFLFENEEEEVIRNRKLKWTKLQELIVNWCTDDNGKNILYKKSGEERYPNFKLYKMIARTVHGCIPSEQLQKPIFAIFSKGKEKEKEKEKEKTIYISIDNIPKLYV
jgi:hypothetical protein